MNSKARQGFDRLLAEYPEAEVARTWNQDDAITEIYEHVEGLSGVTFDFVRSTVYSTNSGPWTCVDLLTAPGTIGQFAIWNYTGNVYRLDKSGAVEDDPFIVITTIREGQ